MDPRDDWLDAWMERELMRGNVVNLGEESTRVVDMDMEIKRDAAMSSGETTITANTVTATEGMSSSTGSSLQDMDFAFCCPLCKNTASNAASNAASSDKHRFTAISALAEHLREFHHIDIRRPRAVRFVLDEYLARALEGRCVDASSAASGPSGSVQAPLTLILGTEDDLYDKKLRAELNSARLTALLAQQSQDHSTNALQPHNCLFCRTQPYPTRHALFLHMFTHHNFSLGHPDNLIDVRTLLAVLRRKLDRHECLFCERVFKTGAVLRLHMRKKRHFRVNPRNELYDRFYINNYRDPERDWQELAAEEDAMALSDDSDAAAPQQPSSYTPSTTADRDMDTHDDDHDHLSDARFDDWDSPVPSASAPCLFCPHVESSAQSLLTTHLPTAHGFHATTLLGPLDFYDRVKLVNYTRRQTAHACCFACGHEAAGDEELGEHFEVAGCTRNGQLPVRDCAFWNDPQFLFPFMEDDPVLQALGENDDQEENCEGQTRADVAMDRMKRQFEHIRVDAK